MKLYATTTSERASKGQGGNEKIIIELFNEDRDKLIYIEAIPDGTNVRIFCSLNNKYYYLPAHSKELKGKSQKGEKCEVCKEEYKMQGFKYCFKCMNDLKASCN